MALNWRVTDLGRTIDRAKEQGWIQLTVSGGRPGVLDDVPDICFPSCTTFTRSSPIKESIELLSAPQRKRKCACGMKPRHPRCTVPYPKPTVVYNFSSCRAHSRSHFDSTPLVCGTTATLLDTASRPLPAIPPHPHPTRPQTPPSSQAHRSPQSVWRMRLHGARRCIRLTPPVCTHCRHSK